MRWRDFKAAVPIETILAHAGKLHTLRRQGHRLVGPCPIHGGDNPRAFRVDCPRGLWYCFTRCGTGGDSLSLAYHLCERSWPETARWLTTILSNAPASLSPPRALAQAAPCRRRPFVPFSRRLPLATQHPFFEQRGLLPRTLELFHAGVWPRRGFLEGMAAVRLFDPSGQPLGYAGRRLDPNAVSSHGKWKWPPAFPKSETLYSWHRARPFASPGLIVVEGLWSVMKLAQAGYPNTIALGGTALSIFQSRLLRQAPRLVLMLDGDEAGRQASQRFHSQRIHPSIHTLQLPHLLDPADLSEEDLRIMLTPLFPAFNHPGTMPKATLPFPRKDSR